jgi:YihY family inner membrane protein
LSTTPSEKLTKLPSPQVRWIGVRKVLEQSLIRFFNEDSFEVSASIAYHSLLSIFPFILLLITLSGFLITQEELAPRLAMIFNRFLPVRADFIFRNIAGVTQVYSRVGGLSLLLLLWSSAGIFLPLEKALNRAWGVENERSWVHRHLLALEMALVVGIIFFLSSVVVGINVYLHNWVRIGSKLFPSLLVSLAYHSTVVVVTFTLTLTMFIVLFKVLPNRHMSFRHVLPSALMTAVFWEAARSLFTLLLPSFNYRQVYGSIGVVVALMTWIYISSAVTLFGAQVSHTLYRSLRPEQSNGGKKSQA